MGLIYSFVSKHIATNGDFLRISRVSEKFSLISSIREVFWLSKLRQALVPRGKEDASGGGEHEAEGRKNDEAMGRDRWLR
ncbi:hypothetical protein EA58_10855 [Photobacterium galatheae]|uniref:Uncharacterized protein n=1 Tax=Photobacterium galatheae TaxID=1654360 RepID=A0A066RQW3_9GAMM|nr:hypothetical protein EA58_10855 [Photobacterium galatheae]